MKLKQYPKKLEFFFSALNDFFFLKKLPAPGACLGHGALFSLSLSLFHSLAPQNNNLEHLVLLAVRVDIK
jgi:hypothetical protein